MLSRYAIKTLWGPRLALVLVVLEVANLWQRGRPWRGELLWTVEWMGIVHFVVGPLLAGVAAVDAARMAQPGALEFLAVSRRRHGAFVWAAAWTALPACLVHSAGLAVALLWAQRHWGGAEVGSAALAFAVQLVAFCWYSALGSAVGRFMPVLAAGPVAAVAAMGLFFRLADGDGFLLMHFGASTVSRLGVELNANYLWLQFFVLGGTAVLLAAPRVWPSTTRIRRAPHLAGVTMLALALVVLVSVGSWGPEQRQELADPYPPDRCFGESPTVCYYPQHLRMAGPSLEAIEDFAERARRAGYDDLVPKTIHETSRSYFPSDPEIKGLHMEGREFEGKPPSPELLVQSLIFPHHCLHPDRPDGPVNEDLLYDFHFPLVEKLYWIYMVEGTDGAAYFDLGHEDGLWWVGAPYFDLNSGEKPQWYDQDADDPNWPEPLTPDEASEAAARMRACDF